MALISFCLLLVVASSAAGTRKDVIKIFVCSTYTKYVTVPKEDKSLVEQLKIIYSGLANAAESAGLLCCWPVVSCSMQGVA